MLSAVKQKDQTETDDGEGKKLIAACIIEECIQPATRKFLEDQCKQNQRFQGNIPRKCFKGNVLPSV